MNKIVGKIKSQTIRAIGKDKTKIIHTETPIKITTLLTIIPTILISVFMTKDSNQLSSPEPFLCSSPFLFQGEKNFKKSDFIEKNSNKNIARFFHVINKEIIALL